MNTLCVLLVLSIGPLVANSQQPVCDLEASADTLRTLKGTVDSVVKRLHCHLDQPDDKCNQCFDQEDLKSLLKSGGFDENKSVTGEGARTVSSLVLQRLIDFRAGCTTYNVSKCQTVAECKTKLQKQLGLEGNITYTTALDKVEILFRQLKDFVNTVPAPAEKCVTAQNILEELTFDNSTERDVSLFTDELSGAVIQNFFCKGKCLQVADAAKPFLDELMHRYSSSKKHVMSNQDLERLLKDVKTPASAEGDSHHDHDHDHHHHAPHPDDDKKNDGPLLHKTDFVRARADDHHHDDDHDHEHDDDHDHDGDHDHSHDTNSKAHKCLTDNEMLEHFGFLSKPFLKAADLIEICPAAVQQAVSGVCRPKKTKEPKKPQSSWELYGYSTIAVTIISLMSLVVVVILPLLNKNFYQYLMMCMIGLAFGTMAGDALLHLIPQGLGLHSHSQEESDHDHEEHEHDNSVIWRQLGIMAAVYGIYIFESLMEIMTASRKSSEHGHAHNLGGHGHSHVPDNKAVYKANNGNSVSQMELASVDTSNDVSEADNSPNDPEPVFKTPVVCCGLRSMAWVITLGDTIHNLGDGLAIGAAFSASTQSGLSTSIAVLCHELPHEFGDFVVLLSTGLSFKKALLLNFLSALSCYVGLYIGIAVGSDETTRLWIMIVTAGIFLYVALTEMLPELKQNLGSNRAAMFFMKNLGILSGVAAMVIIAIYEDSIVI